jgi:leucyl aminopeptidase
MSDPDLSFILAEAPGALPVHPVRPAGLDVLLAALPPAQAAFLRGAGFAARAQELLLLPGEAGLAGAVLGLGAEQGPAAFGDLALRLPEGPAWRLEPGDYDPARALLGYGLGAYRFTRLRAADRRPARLLAPAGSGEALAALRASWMVRDLINMPANLLGPAELADAAASLAARHGAAVRRVEGAALADAYPALAAVGHGSDRKPVVLAFTWAGSGAAADAPLVSLCGKGVCFDTGGYDLKPSAGMLKMKKDMGGAATVLGIARMVMEADLPVRLAVRIGCVENSVSGRAMRPMDILRTRKGLTVEIGNTDAEGRLVLCDLLDEASAEAPALLLDCATLTGAARVALGPDLPALFCNDEAWAAALFEAGTAAADPLWRLPLWPGYDPWLKSAAADMNNVAGKPFAGAIVAALFLQRFVRPGTAWAHLDLYAWNDSTAPARPEGGEAQAMRAIVGAIRHRLAS